MSGRPAVDEQALTFLHVVALRCSATEQRRTAATIRSSPLSDRLLADADRIDEVAAWLDERLRRGAA